VGQRRASAYQTQRKSLIIREWGRWLQAHSIDRRAATPRDTLRFFYELQDKRSPLLKFEPRGRDKWNIVSGWLLSGQNPGPLAHRNAQAEMFGSTTKPRTEQAAIAVTGAEIEPDSK
jgi:hypothetical protein